MAQSISKSHGLTFGQGMGIGIAVGFVGALLLVGIVLFVTKTRILPSDSLDRKLQVDDRPPVSRALPPGEIQAVALHVVAEPEWPREESWVVNPITKIRKDLPARLNPLISPRQIKDNDSLEFTIHLLAYNYISGINFDPLEMPIVEETIFNEEHLVRLAGEPVNGGTWSESISNRSTRRNAFKCFLAQVLFKRMNPLADVKENLLPPDIANFYQQVHCVHSHRERQRRLEDILAVLRECIYLIRGGTYHLLPEPAVLFEPGDPRTERTHAMAKEVVEALKMDSLNINLHSTEDFEVAMNGLMEMAANFAMVLFCQPTMWDAVWKSDTPGFIVYPKIRLLWNNDVVKYSKEARVEHESLPPGPSPLAVGGTKHDDGEH